MYFSWPLQYSCMRPGVACYSCVKIQIQERTSGARVYRSLKENIRSKEANIQESEFLLANPWSDSLHTGMGKRLFFRRIIAIRDLQQGSIHFLTLHSLLLIVR